MKHAQLRVFVDRQRAEIERLEARLLDVRTTSTRKDGQFSDVTRRMHQLQSLLRKQAQVPALDHVTSLPSLNPAARPPGTLQPLGPRKIEMERRNQIYNEQPPREQTPADLFLCRPGCN